MNHLQGTRSKCLRFDFTFIKRRAFLILHEIRGVGCGAMLSLVSSILVLQLASPAYSQQAPDMSATAAPDKTQTGAVATDRFNPALGEAQTLKGAQTPPGAVEAALRRELAAARAELARQAQALREQQQTDEALTANLEIAQRAIENFRTEASLWDSKKDATPEAPPSADASRVATNQSLDQERHKVELLEQDLATARQTIDALKTGASLAAAEQAKAVADRQVADAAAAQALDEKHHKVELLEQDLATARQTIDALKTGANLAAAEQARAAAKDRQMADAAAAQALDEERHKVELLEQDLATARQNIDALKAGANLAAAEQAKAVKDRQLADAAATQALNEERHKVELLEQDLAKARQATDSVKTGANPAVADQAKAEKDRQMADAAATQDEERHKVQLLEQELATARQTIDALKTGANLAAAEQAKAVKDRQVADAASGQAREALETERQRADSALRDLDLARKERDGLKQSSMDLSATLDQVRERASGLALSLTAARADIDAIKDKRPTVAVVCAPRAGTSKSALANSPSRSVAARKPDLPKKRKVKGRKSPQPVMLATTALPAALLPIRPPAP